MTVYKRAIGITEQSGSQLTDYQIKLTFGAGDPIFTHAASGGSDIRITDTSGDASPYLDHYIEDYDAGAETATIWVNVPSIPASGSDTIYCYYGDGQNKKAPSGIATFPHGFYDLEQYTDGQDVLAASSDWSAANDSWYGDTTPTLTAYNSYAQQGSVGLQHTTDVLEGSQYALATAIDSGTANKWVREFYMKITEESASSTHGMSAVADASNTEENIYGPDDNGGNSPEVRYYNGSGWVTITSNVTNGDWVWIYEEIDFSANQTYTEVYTTQGGSLLGSGTAGFRVSTNSLAYKLILGDGATTGEDLFRIRKWAATEPTTSIGSETTTAPAPPSGTTITSTDRTTTTIEWTDESDKETEFRIYRSASSGVTTSDTLAGTVSSTTEASTGTVYSYQDSDLTEDTAYYYAVTAVDSNGGESDLSPEASGTTNRIDTTELSNEASSTTDLPAPSGVTVSVTSGDQLDVQWTDNATDESGYRVYVRPTGESSWTNDSGDLAADTTAHTTAALLDGEQYDVRVEVFTADATNEAIVSPAATTVLPDTTNLTLDNSIEDQVVASTPDVTDYGDYRWQVRETGEGQAYGFIAETTTAHDDPDTVFTSLEDGEKYDVRVRTETEHVTGAWYEATVVTLLPKPTSLAIGTVGASSVDLSWTDESDNEDGMRVERAQQYADGFSGFGEIADLAVNSTSYSDGSVSPDTTYQYQITAYTEHVVASSASVQTTTDALGVPRSQASGEWYVEVDHPSGNVLRPTVTGQPTARPVLNARPTVEIPIPRTETYQDSAFEGAPLRVWKDGQRLPIDTLDDVQVEPTRTVLVGSGGAELEKRVQTEVDSQPAHTLVDTLLSSNTSYTANVDDPGVNTDENQTVQSADSQSEFNDRVRNLQATDPVEVTSGGSVRPLQTCWTAEGENADSSTTSSGGLDSSYSGGSSAPLSSTGDFIEFTFTPQYDIPDGEFALGFRWVTETAGSDPTVEIFVDGNSTGSTLFSNPSLGWTQDIFGTGSFTRPGALSGGTQHTVRIEIASGTGATLAFDVVAPYDQRYSYTFDNDNGGSDGYLDGPQYYPQAVKQQFEDAVVAYSVTGGRVGSTWDDTSNGQALEISNDQGKSWLSASNTSTLEQDFGDAGTTIRWRATLGRHGSRTTATPQTGYQPQTLQSYTLRADLSPTPVLTNTQFDGALDDVLTQIAAEYDFLWELQYDNGQFSVEYTRPGLRSSDATPTIANYSVSKNASSIATKCVVIGAAQPVRDESVTASSGTAVALAEDRIVPSSERVTDGSGTVYLRNQDYEIDTLSGELTALASGDIADGQSLSVDYQHKLSGSYESPAYAGDPAAETVEQLPSATTERACRQLARVIVESVEDPIWTASVDISERKGSWSLVDDLSIEGIPSRVPALEVQEVSNSPSGVSLQLGSRDPISEVVDRIQRRLETTSQRV